MRVVIPTGSLIRDAIARHRDKLKGNGKKIIEDAEREFAETTKRLKPTQEDRNRRYDL